MSKTKRICKRLKALCALYNDTFEKAAQLSEVLEVDGIVENKAVSDYVENELYGIADDLNDKDDWIDWFFYDTECGKNKKLVFHEMIKGKEYSFAPTCENIIRAIKDKLKIKHSIERTESSVSSDKKEEVDRDKEAATNSTKKEDKINEADSAMYNPESFVAILDELLKRNPD